jgi:hypothetical protein
MLLTIFIFLALTCIITYHIWEWNLDYTKEGELILWWTDRNTGERKYKILTNEE